MKRKEEELMLRRMIEMMIEKGNKNKMMIMRMRMQRKLNLKKE